MKILFISAQYPPHTKGGGELSCHLVAKGLVERGHEVKVISEGVRREEDVVDGVRVVRIPAGLVGKPLFERRHSKKSAKVLMEEIKDASSYDVIHAHDFRSAMALFETGIENGVVTVRDYAYISGDTNNILVDGSVPQGKQKWNDLMSSQRIAEASVWRKPFRAWQYIYNIRYRREVLASFNRRVFISRAEKEEYRKHGVENDSDVVIYNPVQSQYLTTVAENGVGGHVLYVGRVEMYKGVGVLFSAWREIMKMFPNATLTVVGEGAQREEYEQFVRRNGMQYKVNFVGYVKWNRMMSLFDKARVVVSPHLWVEPFGRAVVEGMSRGKIIVAANHGGPSEVIEHERTGLLFEHGSVDGLISELKRALEMKQLDTRTMTSHARQWASDNLSVSHIADQYEEYYKGIIGE